jgi:Domain of unknown function (DUF3471)
MNSRPRRCVHSDMPLRLLVVLMSMTLLAARAPACTAFSASNGRLVLVGNNEDDNNPFTSLWFVPAGKGKYGRLYVGYDNFDPQGGMNERGLWFDAFSAAPLDTPDSAKPVFHGNLTDKAIAECATVDEVVRLFEQYNRSFMKGYVLMFADASGGSVIIEPAAILRKTGRYQVQTNFHQSLSKPEYVCDRFEIATKMLNQAGDRISLGLFRRILAATHEEQTYPTVYSNIYDLKRRVMYLYHFHNFENAVRIDLRAELRKGVHAVSLPSLFPVTHSSAEYTRVRAKEMHRVEPPVVKVDPNTFDDYAGSYRLENGVHFVILREADRLLLDAEPLGKVEIYPESATTFFLRITDAHIRFVRGDDGKVNRVIARISGRESPGVRVQ